MTSGHLQEKNGLYYAVLSYNDAQGKRRTKWVATGFTVKGNKKRAEAVLAELRLKFDAEAEAAVEAEKEQEPEDEKNELFADYLERWLEIARGSIAAATYGSYQGLLSSVIVPWFRKTGVTLVDLNARDIQKLYTSELRRVSANTVIHYHAVIHRALKYAVKTDLIPVNPADKVDRPKKSAFRAEFYDSDEIKRLFECVQGTDIEVPVKLAAFYGLRKSEALGLKWKAVDFENGTLTIQHTVVKCCIDGKYQVIEQDTTKTKSSRRTLPLTAPVRDLLLRTKAAQEENKYLCGNCYYTQYEEYICVTEMGKRINPSRLSETFTKILSRNGLKKIRFHDLRHSCASLLISNGVPLKQIQEWLGHSDFTTTANIYAHLSPETRKKTADAMLNGLGTDW